MAPPRRARPGGRPATVDRIVAIEPTICFILSPQAFDELWTASPDACASLALAIARSLSDRLRYSTADVAALDRPDGAKRARFGAAPPAGQSAVMTVHCCFVRGLRVFRAPLMSGC